LVSSSWRWWLDESDEEAKEKQTKLSFGPAIGTALPKDGLGHQRALVVHRDRERERF